MSKNSELYDVDYRDTVPFIPPITYGKIIKVYDGDTITIAAKLPYANSELYRFSVRINGIDCPEIRTKNANEKTCALIAKNLIIDKAMNKMVKLENVSTEKYGRILADVICEGGSLGDILIKERLAVKYDGGTKKTPSDWLSYYSQGELIPEEGSKDAVPKKEPFYKRIFSSIRTK